MTDERKGPEKIDLRRILDQESSQEDDEIQVVGEGSAAAPPSPEAPDGGAGPAAGADGEPDPEERILRLRADFDNYRKRKQKETEEFRARAGESLVAELLPVLDNLERALQGARASSADAFRQGVELIQRQLLDVLKAAGLEPIEAVGRPFDPEIHEAVTRAESADRPPNVVLEQMQTGYKFQGRLLRPSMVKVSCPPEASAPQGEGADGSAVS